MAVTRFLERSLRLLVGVGLSGILFVQAPRARADDARSSHDLYLSGKGNEALAKAKRELAIAELQGTPEQSWQPMMYVAWLEESLGEHREAMKYAARALDLAATQADAFRIGRSLCWLGWSATSLGLYPLALEFYDDAIGTASDGGNVIQPMVWGLATQATVARQTAEVEAVFVPP